jgi:hypothetical protein
MAINLIIFPIPHMLSRPTLATIATIYHEIVATSVVVESSLSPGTSIPLSEIFVGQGQAESAIVGHFPTSLDENVDVVGIVEWLGSSTDDGKRGRDVGCP